MATGCPFHLRTWTAKPKRRPRPAPFPGPRGFPLLGDAPAFARDPLSFLTATARRFGDAATFRVFSDRVVLLSHPQAIERILNRDHGRVQKTGALRRIKPLLGDGLLTSDGAVHAAQKRRVQPAFTPKNVAAALDDIVEGVLDVFSGWRSGDALELNRMMNDLTYGVTLRVLFGESARRHAIKDHVAAILDYVEILKYPGMNRLQALPLPVFRRYRESHRILNQFVDALIERGGASVSGRATLLSRWIDAARESSSPIGRQELKDNIFTFLLAGHETAATTLTWSFLALMGDPAVEEPLRAEARTAWRQGMKTGPEGGQTLTERVLLETMRVYPPVWNLTRVAAEELAIDGKTVPSGTIIMMSPWVVHRDPRWFPDPERFDPARWSKEDPARPRFSYFPFGGGPRVCIGAGLAMTELRVILGLILSRWRFRRRDTKPVGFKPRITLRPRDPIAVDLESLQ